MLIYKIEYDKNKISNMLQKFEYIFIEFDRDFINKRGLIKWRVTTMYWLKNIYEVRDLLINMIMNNETLNELTGINILIGRNDLVFECETDVTHVGDDVWAMYQSPVLIYDASTVFNYFICKMFEPYNMTGKGYSEICFELHNSPRKLRTVYVEFVATGRYKYKYYNLVRDMVKI